MTSQSRVTSQAPTSSRAWLTPLPMPHWHSLWGTEDSWCARGPVLSFSENEALTREQRGPGAKGSSSSPLAFFPKAEWFSEPESHWAQPQAAAPAPLIAQSYQRRRSYWTRPCPALGQSLRTGTFPVPPLGPQCLAQGPARKPRASVRACAISRLAGNPNADSISDSQRSCF